MPQLDKFVFFNQYFWFSCFFIVLYFLTLYIILPLIFKILKFRLKKINYLISLKENLSVQKSNLLEDINSFLFFKISFWNSNISFLNNLKSFIFLTFK